MIKIFAVAMALALLSPGIASSQPLRVTIDASAATAVLDALGKPNLTIGEALKIAQLPGNQGLIRKSKSYGNNASDLLFAKALVAAARHDDTYSDSGRFQFTSVRSHAGETRRTLIELGDEKLHLLDNAKLRVMKFAPANLAGEITGYMVAGGTSGGFAFGEPSFYLDIDRYRSSLLASTIMSHELYHAVQALARTTTQQAARADECINAIPSASHVSDFLNALLAEGTASFVGDILAIPNQTTDRLAAKERGRFVANLDLVGRSVTQLELSVHGLTTAAAVSPEEVYELGFYGDEVMYSLGYFMTRAIAEEDGDAAVGQIIGLSGANFVERYSHLKKYGKSDQVPALRKETIQWAHRISSCR